MTEVWFRNPHNYIRELVVEDQTNIVWDRGILNKFRLDPTQHAKLYFGPNAYYKLLLVGAQGAAELRPGYTTSNPYAVYPVWEYTDDTEILEELVSEPVGEDESLCVKGKYAPDETPVFGQPHRVVIMNPPPSNTGVGKRFLSFLVELQQDYPDCIIHYHGTYSWRVAFGLGFASSDVDARITASKGNITLPTGRTVLLESAALHRKWITLLGFKPVDMRDPSMRCRYNIRSAEWAGEHFLEAKTLPSRTTEPWPDEAEQLIVRKPLPFYGKAKREGDKFTCNTCSVQLTCDYFRLGSVCAVPGSEPVSLSTYFNTRDSEQILKGLGTLMAINTRRLDYGLLEEEEKGLNPEVTKIVKQLFDNAVTLAKLVDPALRDPKLAINAGPGGTVNIINASPSQAVSSIIRALEMKGIRREDITPKMIENLLESMALNHGNEQKAIEGTVISSRDEAV